MGFITFSYGLLTALLFVASLVTVALHPDRWEGWNLLLLSLFLVGMAVIADLANGKKERGIPVPIWMKLGVVCCVLVGIAAGAYFFFFFSAVAIVFIPFALIVLGYFSRSALWIVVDLLKGISSKL